MRGWGKTMGAGLLLVLVFSAVWLPPALATQSQNIRLRQHFEMELGNEIEFQGSRVYVNQYAQIPRAGVHLFEIGADRRLSEKGVLVCRGITDTAALDRGFIAIGLQQGGDRCNTAPGLLGGDTGGSTSRI